MEDDTCQGLKKLWQVVDFSLVLNYRGKVCGKNCMLWNCVKKPEDLRYIWTPR